MAGRGPRPTPSGFVTAPLPVATGSHHPTVAGSTSCPRHRPASRPRAAEVWRGWFTAWWAGNWTPDDLPALRLVIRLWDRVNRGDVKRAAELRQWMDGYGLTPKGQMDRRWARPAPPPIIAYALISAGLLSHDRRGMSHNDLMNVLNSFYDYLAHQHIRLAVTLANRRKAIRDALELLDQGGLIPRWRQGRGGGRRI